MSPGPLRRFSGAIGLIALVPTAVMLVVGSVSLADAAIRAGVTLVVVTVIGRLTGWWLSTMARQFERRRPVTADEAADPTPSA